jgi:phosphotransferase system HPr (HPr) family protein
LGIHWPAERLPDHSFAFAATKRRLPRNMGQEDLVDETQRIAEIASKYLTACEMLENLGIRPMSDATERRRRLSAICKEEQARVYEATVHNLQSTYDTNIKNTVVESRDERLPLLRGHLSGALHMLEAVTFLTHFVERHEFGARGETAEHVIGGLVDRTRIEQIILNDLLHWANTFMQRGRSMAEELLPSYTNLQELQVELPDSLRLHARPAALIVNIVGRYGTPVEMEVDGHRCNAGSILELLVTVGSHPEARSYVFRGDVHPLRDIGLLFENGLGEDGIDNLPAPLHYLQSN